MGVNQITQIKKKRLAIAIQMSACAIALSFPPAVAAVDSFMEDEVFMLEEIIVTGFRRSLQSASDFKRNSINVTDSVFAEDVGKFPDLNIAEALNRVPGIQLTREIDGSGVNVAIRGLNTNYTRVTVNGAPIAVASGGRTDAINSNRELDLDVFPTEFFTRLDVSKTPVASMLEGGLSGTVNMRSLRPLDSPNSYLNYQLQGGYGELSEELSPRAALIGSWKNEDRTFGVLGGVSVVRNRVVTQGYETLGWTNANLTYGQCGITPPAGATLASPAGFECPSNRTGGNGYIIGESLGGQRVVPEGTLITGNSGTRYSGGSVIDQDFLLDVNPGLTLDQIGNGLIPRLGRPHYSEGDRDRMAGIASIEWIPNSSSSYYLDLLYAEAERDYDRLSMIMTGRNSRLIPTNMQVDENNIVTRADFHNAHYFLEARPYHEKLDYLSVNPGAQYFIGDTVTLDFALNATQSSWRREVASIGVQTNMQAGVTAEFINDQGGDYPLVQSNIDLNDPNQVAGWGWERALIQVEERDTETLGARFDFTLGEPLNNYKAGVSVDRFLRNVKGYDASYQWRQAVDNNISANLIPEYLVPGPFGFVTVDFDSLKEQTNYASLVENASFMANTATGAPSGDIEELTLGLYAEANREFVIADRSLRANAGLRAVQTDTDIVGYQQEGDEVTRVEATNSFQRLLPSLNLAYDLTDRFVLRAATSRTLTRANPVEMNPAVQFTDTSAQTATRGNAALKPFMSTNFDLGLEWYARDESYAAINVFNKQISGFTQTVTRQRRFGELGIDMVNLAGPQQDALAERGGEDAIINLNTSFNSEGKLDLRGVELLWVQPLPIIYEGLGYSVNYTNVHQSSRGEGVPAFATGVSKNTVNATAYYEDEAFSIRLSYVWYDQQYGSGLGDWGVNSAQRFIEPRGQWDLSASYEFMNLPTSPRVTFNLINFSSDPQREIFSQDNATYQYYNPGFTAILGVRGVLF